MMSGQQVYGTSKPPYRRQRQQVRASFRAIRDKVVIERDAPVNETLSGIVLPNMLRTSEGTVISAGPWCSPGISPGDKVCFLPDVAGAEFRDRDGKTYLFLRESSIMGVIQREP